ncbi:hypothetical protein OGAPHI_002298 [Ogataea philodendri]|uniref:Hpc2-related domain-containing protein n=1 Tax=Ogataea philodendri TaxID=1378263 RepID=A0A9P8PBQ2_9ASCO|nr:uncharacterized protein OGAPHI_002298 [Ogataea philodendri]KAH3668544.1 hypothetical protein OGAPHI_002298 [Ogataea philodendri]
MPDQPEKLLASNVVSGEQSNAGVESPNMNTGSSVGSSRAVTPLRTPPVGQSRTVNRMSLSSMINMDAGEVSASPLDHSEKQTSELIVGGFLPGVQTSASLANSNTDLKTDLDQNKISAKPKGKPAESDRKEITRTNKSKSTKNKPNDPMKNEDKSPKKKSISRIDNAPSARDSSSSSTSQKQEERKIAPRQMDSLPQPVILDVTGDNQSQPGPDSSSLIVALHVPLVPQGSLPGDSQAIFNVMRLCEDKYGFDVMHPNGKIAIDAMDVDEDIAEDENPDPNEEESAEVEEEDDITRRLGMKFKVGMTDEEKEEMILKEIHRKKMESNKRIGKYDLLDPFIDDEELLFEEQTKTNKDGFYVYYGPVADDTNPNTNKRKVASNSGATAKKKKSVPSSGASTKKTDSSLLKIAPKPAVLTNDSSVQSAESASHTKTSSSAETAIDTEEQRGSKALAAVKTPSLEEKTIGTSEELPPNQDKNRIIVGALPPLP